MQGYLIGIIIFGVAIGIFVLQNTAVVAVKFITWQSPRVSIAVVALLALLVGAVLTYLVNGARYLKMGKNVRDLQTKNRKLEKQLQKLNPVAEGSAATSVTTEASSSSSVK
ncbi:MAG: lipopolysaccharide assembly protein LapA domain-containing protein [Methylocystaceae bacterium]